MPIYVARQSCMYLQTDMAWGGVISKEKENPNVIWRGRPDLLPGSINKIGLAQSVINCLLFSFVFDA